MGALVGFEFARWLRKEYGLRPLHLFVSGHHAPHLPNSNVPCYDLPERDFLEKLRTLNGTPPAVLDDSELVQFILPVLRADFEVAQTYSYRPEQPLDVPITALGGLQDSDVPRESLEAWRAMTVADFDMEMVPGDHFFLNTAQEVVLRIIGVKLERYLPGIDGSE
jgi:medium-chain acyl-[acyl-carrier-protein] hydrolase